tara:strand:+ start:540 stop:737 length:198 start_codon:yes stop_codon:yes gene_type:complete
MLKKTTKQLLGMGAANRSGAMYRDIKKFPLVAMQRKIQAGAKKRLRAKYAARGKSYTKAVLGNGA